MPDPAVREKAKELFVINGFTMETICTMLQGQVSRKTLYNYRKDDNWDDERRQRVATNKSRRERLEALIDKYISEAEVAPSPKLIFAIGKLVAALKSTNTFEFSEERQAKEDKRDSGISEETWNKIDERLGLK